MTGTPKEIERLVDRKHIVHYGLLDVEAASVRHNAEVTIEPASKLRIINVVILHRFLCLSSLCEDVFI